MNIYLKHFLIVIVMISNMTCQQRNSMNHCRQAGHKLDVTKVRYSHILEDAKSIYIIGKMVMLL